jgi:hypothetical protein
MAERTCPEAFDNRAVSEKVLKHVSSPFWLKWMPTKERTPGLCRVIGERGESEGTANASKR